jgi:CheY-like chemotaxis protein
MEKRRVLIVDDEPSFTRMVRLNLEKTGLYEVKEENQATHAVTAAEAFRPHLILLDVVMPSKDGGDVATELKQHPLLKRVPIVFVTAIVGKCEGGQTSGGNLFLSKPVTLRGLIQTIERSLPEELQTNL